MCDQANKHRREPDFGVRSAVYIVKKQWVTDRPIDKLDYLLTICSHVIKEEWGHSYHPELPGSWKGSRAFHADRLRLGPRDPLDGDEDALWPLLPVPTSNSSALTRVAGSSKNTSCSRDESQDESRQVRVVPRSSRATIITSCPY